MLDEADRMADMGFLPQVEWVLRHVGGPHQTLLFSATLDGAVDVLVKRYQRDPVHHEVESRTITVEEMAHRFLLVHEMDKAKVAAAISNGVARTMIFTRTKRGADRLAASLKQEGVRAAAIHGDLPQKLRERALDDFQQGRLPVLVATDVAARGLHIDDVDVVVHYDPPQDHKAYLHRSGRTARAGEAGLVVTLVLWNEELEIKRLLPRIGVKQPLVEVFSNDPRLGRSRRVGPLAHRGNWLSSSGWAAGRHPGFVQHGRTPRWRSRGFRSPPRPSHCATTGGSWSCCWRPCRRSASCISR